MSICHTYIIVNHFNLKNSCVSVLSTLQEGHPKLQNNGDANNEGCRMFSHTNIIQSLHSRMSLYVALGLQILSKDQPITNEIET